MKRKIAFLLLLTTLSLSVLSCGGNNVPSDTTADISASGEATDTVTGEPVTTEPVTEAPVAGTAVITKISELNKNAEAYSHSDLNTAKNLGFDYRSFRQFKKNEMLGDSSYYPRLKQLADGSYILFYQSGRWGPNIYYKTSTDLKTWSNPKTLFVSHKTTYGDTCAYATADAAVLDNGDILVVCTYRSLENYAKKNDRNGLVMRRSSDNGKTWTKEEVIYVGTNWEPCVLQLRNGDVHVYFTHTAPYIALYGYNNTIRSSGSAMLVSKDRGLTYSPNVTEPPYEAHRVMQSYVGDLDGIKIMNDQMPVAIELEDGTIFMACETQTIDRKFNISLGWSHDQFATPLGLTEVGPAERTFSTFAGTGPYVEQFVSGETVLSFGRGGFTRIQIANGKAKGFGNEITPMERDEIHGHWTALEVVGSHDLVYVSANMPKVEGPDAEDANNVEAYIVMGHCYLNHKLYSKRMTPVVDGNSSDWSENTDALFIGSLSQAQSTFRFAKDSDKLYILCERLDEYMRNNGDEIVLYISSGGGNNYLKITVDPNGIKEIVESKRGTITKLDVSKIECAMALNGIIEVPGGEENGYIAEIAIPEDVFVCGSELKFYAALKNKDERLTVGNDVFEGTAVDSINTWMTVSFN